MNKIKKLAALSMAAVTMLTGGFLCGNVSDSVVAIAEDQQNPIDIDRVTNVNYEVKNGKIRFTSNSNTYMSYIVSSNLDYTMKHEDLQTASRSDNYIFTPAENGRYVIAADAMNEDIIQCSANDNENSGHFHYFYHVITGYVVDYADGNITISEEFNTNTYSQVQIDQIISDQENAGENYAIVCGDVQSENYNNDLFGMYYSFVNGNMPFGLTGSHLKEYITTVYSRYSTKSYFCVNGGYEGDTPKVSDESLVEREEVLHTSSALTTCDIMDFYRIKAVNDGKLSVFANDVEYKLEVKDGIFRKASDSEEIVMGDANGDGILGVSDAVTLQNGLLGIQPLKYSENIDLCKDGVIDVYDLCLLKKMVVEIPEKNVYAQLSVKTIGYSEELFERALSDESSEVITSTDQLREYLESITGEFNKTAVKNYVSRFDDSFFEENVMLANCIYQSCGGDIMYKINSVCRKNDTIIVKYSDNYKLETYPDVVNGLFAMAIISKDDYNSENVIWEYQVKHFDW